MILAWFSNLEAIGAYDAGGAYLQVKKAQIQEATVTVLERLAGEVKAIYIAEKFLEPFQARAFALMQNYNRLEGEADPDAQTQRERIRQAIDRLVDFFFENQARMLPGDMKAISTFVAMCAEDPHE